MRTAERGWRRRLHVGVMLLSYLAAAIGFPLPNARASSHACGQAVCGCGTAAQCQASGCGCPHSAANQPARSLSPSLSAGGVGARCSSCESDEAEEVPCCQPSQPEPTPEPKAKPTRWVVGIAALKCQGAATTWISIGAVMPSADPVCWSPSWPCVATLAISSQEAPLSAMVPLDPPPRPC